MPATSFAEIFERSECFSSSAETAPTTRLSFSFGTANVYDSEFISKPRNWRICVGVHSDFLSDSEAEVAEQGASELDE